MNPTRIYAVFVRQLYLLGNNPTRLAGNFVWLTIAILQWGFISKYLGTLGRANFSFITVILGALILWEFLTRIQQGLMMAFLEDVWSNNLINFFASPLRIPEYIIGMVMSSIVTGLLGFFIMATIAGLGFGYDIFIIGLSILPFIGILFLFGMAMGLFVCGMIFRLGPTAEWLGWPIPMILSLISGVYYPIDTLPAPLRLVARLFPPPMSSRACGSSWPVSTPRYDDPGQPSSGAVAACSVRRPVGRPAMAVDLYYFPSTLLIFLSRSATV